jgi:hypothetical protein
VPWLEANKTLLGVVAGLLSAAVAWGVIYNSVETTKALALETAIDANALGNRITRVETNYDHILLMLQGINAKLDRRGNVEQQQ